MRDHLYQARRMAGPFSFADPEYMVQADVAAARMRQTRQILNALERQRRLRIARRDMAPGAVGAPMAPIPTPAGPIGPVGPMQRTVPLPPFRRTGGSDDRTLLLSRELMRRYAKHLANPDIAGQSGIRPHQNMEGPAGFYRTSLSYSLPSRLGVPVRSEPRHWHSQGTQVANARWMARGARALTAITAAEIIYQLQTNKDFAARVARLGFEPAKVIEFLSSHAGDMPQSGSVGDATGSFSDRLISALGQTLSQPSPAFQTPGAAMLRAHLTSLMEAAPELPKAFPHIPPELPEDGNESFPAEEPQPVILAGPVPEEGKPALEIFPDMSDLVQLWLYVESRGTVDGQQKDLRYVLERLFNALEERGVMAIHRFGGYSVHDGEYLKERFIRAYSEESGKKGVKGGRRSDGAFEIGGDKKNMLDVNIVDTLADFMTMKKREHAAFHAIWYLKEHVHKERGDTLAIPKSKGQDWNKWKRAVDKIIEDYANAAYGPPVR